MRYRTILLALDMDAKNASVIDYAFAFAEKAGATLHTLHACPVGVAPGGAESRYYADLRERAKQEMEQALALHRGSPSRGKSFLDLNEPITAIVNTAAKLGADLVILSTHGRQGLERVVVGSVAEGVLDEVQVPVLVMRSS
ncbi:MAG: universal stress protein [Myxococcales bacterium]